MVWVESESVFNHSSLITERGPLTDLPNNISNGEKPTDSWETSLIANKRKSIPSSHKLTFNTKFSKHALKSLVPTLKGTLRLGDRRRTRFV